MNKAYIFLAGMFIILAIVLIILPDRGHSDDKTPRELLGDLRNPSRFISTDKVAEMIINQDPTLVLVDVRPKRDTLHFSLPGAHSIPLEGILMTDWVDSLSYDLSKVVLFSNGDILADEAWMLLKRANHTNIHIMKGGLNCWFETIIKPLPPAETASDEEIDLYQFRKGASIYFTGGATAVEQDIEFEAVIVRKKNKSRAVEGGC